MGKRNIAELRRRALGKFMRSKSFVAVLFALLLAGCFEEGRLEAPKVDGFAHYITTASRCVDDPPDRRGFKLYQGGDYYPFPEASHPESKFGSLF